MLVTGRIFWGIGVGFGDHCATIYTAEMAPPAWRGTLNTLFQLATISGIVIAGAVNIGTGAELITRHPAIRVSRHCIDDKQDLIPFHVPAQTTLIELCSSASCSPQKHVLT